jgi:phosphoglycerate dehydrogenase-like enzyme/ribulose-5-phosphate 4-epimerase/fuculose-1-phosphate aldolase/SAM-dependent methyltransferase
VLCSSERVRPCDDWRKYIQGTRKSRRIGFFFAANDNTETNTMIRSESGAELLNAPDLSVPFKMRDFEVFGIGGGFLVVNHYGDYILSAARIDIGVMGEDWVNVDSALLYLHRTAGLTSTKCKATGLKKVGGAGALLYFNSKDMDTNPNRKVLLSALIAEMQNFTKTNILCLPANLTPDDLLHIYEANEAMKILPSQDGEEKKADLDAGDAFLPLGMVGRKGSFALASEAFEYPVPRALILAENINEKIAAKSAAHSSFGSIVTLTKAKQWTNCRIVLLGVTPLSCELYHLLTRETDTVFLSDPDASKYEKTKIPPLAFIAWDKARASQNNWDIIVFCSTACPILEASTISSIQCKAVIALSDDFLPFEQDKRYQALMQLQKKDIFEVVDGMSDLGEIAKVYSVSEGSNLSFTDAFELGRHVMQKKLHLHGIITSDDVTAKRKFHDLMLHALEKDENARLFGLGTVMHQSSDRMTDWLWRRARGMCPGFRALSSETVKPNQVRYLDMGAGNGAAARWICKVDKRIHITCIDVDPKQCAENRNLSDEEGLGSQIDVQQGSYERLNSDYSNYFDGCMSQDAFIHAFDKLHAFSEAFRVTKGGGWLLISDLMRGDGKDGNEEMEAFVKEHSITNWATPNQCVDLARKAGWAEVIFIDCTAEIKASLQGLLQKIKAMIESGNFDGKNLQLLQTHRLRLSNRIGLADRGVFKWGIISGRKPYDVVFMSEPPVAPEPRDMIKYSINDLDGDLKFGTDVLVVNIKEKLTRETIMELPSTTRLIVTLSAGLDHICVEAANERGIRIRRAAREAIVKSVADYLLSNIIFGLRNGFQNVGVPFPGSSWNLTWNSDGVDLDCSKVGFIGLGAIAIETARRIRSLSKNCELVYHVPEGIRCRFEEGTHQMRHVGIADLLSTCDVIVPMVPLTESTTGLITYSSFAMMKESAIFINMARGKVVETAGMLRALEERLVRHAILDTTDPEPLPPDHDLWSLKNCTITPHFATNTTWVRKELVEDIPNQVEDTLEERGILRLEEQRMRVELSEAYRITREFGMDELVWNHISVLLSDGSFLITPGSRMFDDIGPGDLVKSSGNVTADIIHEAVYKTRSDIKAIVHLHTPATVAVSCLEMGFVPLAQEAAPFIGRVSRHPWHGVSNDREEQALIGECIRDEKINTLLMENHGFCTFGKTLGEAWVLAYYFDKACQTQLNCLQTGQKLNIPSEKVLAHAAEQSLLPEFLPGACEWDALRKMLTRTSRYRR